MTKWLSSLTVFRRILGGFLVIIALVAIVTLVSLAQLDRFRETTDEAVPTSHLLRLFQGYTETLSSLDSDIERFLVVGWMEIRHDVEQGTVTLNQLAAEIELSAPDSLVSDVAVLQRATQDLVAETTALLNGEDADSRARNEQTLSTFNAVNRAHDALQQSVEAALTQLQTTIVNQEDIVVSVLTQQLVLAMLVIGVASIGSYLITRSIVTPLSHIMATTAEVARGNYTHAEINSRDEIGQLAHDFNEMVDTLQQRESELKIAQRIADENSRLKSEFLATMSHELRTPMNAIEGFTSIMLSGMGGVTFNDKAERYITRVNVNSKRLLQLINDFLDLSRVESGRLEFASQPFSPVELAQRWKTEIGVLAENKNLALELDLDPDLPDTILGDEEAISKVAINLLSNAIKFTEEGKVSLSLQNDGQEWRIIVGDTGIGIPPHARDFIFEEFRQVDQTSKRKYGGTGLGLAIVQKYTRTMGGTISLQSEVGEGSTFTVTLPLVSQPQIVEHIA